MKKLVKLDTYTQSLVAKHSGIMAKLNAAIEESKGIVVAESELEASKSMKELRELKLKYNSEIEAEKEKISKLSQALKDFSSPLSDSAEAEMQRLKDGLAALAESRKIATVEAQRKIDEAAARKQDRARKALEKKAKEAEEKGLLSLAEELRNQAKTLFIAAPIVQLEKTEGITEFTQKNLTVTNKRAAIGWLLQSPITSQFVTIDTAGLLKVFRGQIGDGLTFPPDVEVNGITATVTKKPRIL